MRDAQWIMWFSRSVNVFMAAYILIFAISVLLIGIDNFDLVTNFTAVAATLNNIGPGLELVRGAAGPRGGAGGGGGGPE